MTAKTICIYHGNCADGFGAAWALRRAIPDAEFHPATHGDSPPDVTGKHVYIVDFSYKKPVIESMAEQALTITIIDHHKTAVQDLAEYQSLDGEEKSLGWMCPPLSAPDFYQALKDCGLDIIANIRAHFDMDKSGAVLTWEHFFPDEPPPQLLLHIQDRDLWRFELPNTRKIQAALFSHPYDFDVWDQLSTRLGSLVADGEAIERKHFKDINEFILVASYRDIIAGHVVPVLNAPYFWSSDACQIMGKGEPFAACYWDSWEYRIYSLRSEDNGIDVSKVAEKYDGGGHEHAAGFRIHLDLLKGRRGLKI